MQERMINFEQVVNLAQQLSPLDKLRVIKSLFPDLETPLQAPMKLRRRSLRGLLKGCSISAEEIDRARQEMWGNFPREDL
ncbi:hypothetical protein KJ693_02635 [bacterium]|nr:hypothetical protein [bacterium]